MLPWKPTSQATAGSMEGRTSVVMMAPGLCLCGERDTVELEVLRSVLQLAVTEPHLRMWLPLWPANSTGNIKLNGGNEHVSIL